MNNAILLVSPIINVIVTGLFTGTILRQFLRRHRLYQLYWSIALGMAFLATLAYVLMIVVQPASRAGVVFFRVYYILGAALMPSWLGMGSIALVGKERLKRVCLILLCFLSLLDAAFIFAAAVNIQKLSHIAGTPGTGILQPDVWLGTTIILNSLGVVAIVAVAIYSAWKLIRRQASIAHMQTLNLLWGNVLILIGALLDAAAGSLARFLGLQSTFWLVMAVGWIVFFCGVMLTGRRSASKQSAIAQPAPSPEVSGQKKQVPSS
jgi:hypothetical protein